MRQLRTGLGMRLPQPAPGQQEAVVVAAAVAAVAAVVVLLLLQQPLGPQLPHRRWTPGV